MPGLKPRSKPRSSSSHQSTRTPAVEHPPRILDWCKTPLSTLVEFLRVSRHQEDSMPKPHRRLLPAQKHRKTVSALPISTRLLHCPSRPLFDCWHHPSFRHNCAPKPGLIQAASPATGPENAAPIQANTLASFCDFLETQDEWQLPLLEHLECTSNEQW